MRKFLLTLAIVFSTLFSFSQTTTQKNWTIQERGQWGSFYWKVERSTYADNNGVYWYYVYFYSNSLFNSDRNRDGQLDKAITYIKSPKLFMYEYSNGKHVNTVTFPMAFVICDYYFNLNQYVVYFTSYSKYNTFGLTYQSVSPYHYSNY